MLALKTNFSPKENISCTFLKNFFFYPKKKFLVFTQKIFCSCPTKLISRTKKLLIFVPKNDFLNEKTFLQLPKKTIFQTKTFLYLPEKANFLEWENFVIVAIYLI